MPQVFKIGSYVVYFWIAEGKPLEPIHVHVAEGVPEANATKIWITKSGNTLLANNNSKIPNNTLRKIMKVIDANVDEIINKWTEYFEKVEYYC